ncbi:RHS repeat domain-containing protein [Pseudomonas capsici]|uniref:RHS repeat domain-containing protein n=1 Tax=Pseudomonas capsici TaxID=2810614 RepID=UPI0021F1F700|nr:RHS repeat-associated core domain-containing protein [Pseudomonas capsici]MCV4339638.1 RHS repeat-associated core domain-containing protein [Pseudomonas capsici]
MAAAEARVSRQYFDEAGRLVGCQDPRLGQSAGSRETRPVNLINLFSLSGVPLFSDSVDAGWRSILPGEAGESLTVWDGRGSIRHNAFDILLRPTTVVEQASGEPARTVEHIAYGGADQWANNLCGRLVRHDDTAGVRLLEDYGLHAVPLSEQHRFLRELEHPDYGPDPGLREDLFEPGAAITQWRYNAMAQVIQQIDASLNVRRFDYDVAGHRYAVSLQLNGADAIPVLSGIAFNAFDQVEREVAGNGLRTYAEYCPLTGRLLHLESGFKDQPAVQSLDYEYDPVGNVTSVHDQAQPSRFFRNQRIDYRNTYSYDSLCQLICATGYEMLMGEGWRNSPGQYSAPIDPGRLANYQERYEYDAAGNLQQMTHSGGNNFTHRFFIASGSNRSLQFQGDWIPGDPQIIEGFDANGNQRELVRGQVLEWNIRNQLWQVTPVTRDDGRNDSERYIYASNGQRLRKVHLAQAKTHVRVREVRYLPGLQLCLDSAGAEVWQSAELEAGRSRVTWTTVGTSDTFGRYSLTDHLGSISLEFDETGNLLSQESYSPYGSTTCWASGDNPQAGFKSRRYCGKECDATGLYYYGQRYYAPWLQRWINPDPGGAIDGLNLYRFVRNNPVTLTDPRGLSPSVTLLYGFDTARDLYLEHQGEDVRQSLVSMDKINAGLGITPETLLGDYEAITQDLSEGYEVDEEGVEAFMQISSPHFKGSFEEAREMLQGWSDFLKQNQSSFDVRAKINRYANAGQPQKISAFWKKNMDKAMPVGALEDATKMLQENPADLFESASGQAKQAAEGVTNWLFRRFSKLGLDWVASESSARPSEVVFLDIGLKNPLSPEEGWQDLASEQFQAQPFKTAPVHAGAYEPITYSERRHLERNKTNPSQRVRFVNIAQLHG